MQLAQERWRDGNGSKYAIPLLLQALDHDYTSAVVDTVGFKRKRLRYSAARFTQKPAKGERIGIATRGSADKRAAFILSKIFTTPICRIEALGASAFFDVEVSTLPFCISRVPALE